MKNDYLVELSTYIAGEYNFTVKKMCPANRGFFGETWECTTKDANYFVKIDYWDYHKEIYRRSLPIIDFMTTGGMTFIPRILKTKSGKLSSDFHGGVVSIFDFVIGENTEDYPLEALFARLVQIYKLDGSKLEIEIETLDTSIINQYAECRNKLPKEDNLSQKILEVLDAKVELINKNTSRLHYFSAKCTVDRSNFHITHGDAGGNCIISGDSFNIIDWDYPKLAPIERDAWFFMCDEKQLKTINETLSKNNIEYTLNIDRLCYYCYYSFFYYITEYLRAYLSSKNKKKKQNLVDSLEQYLNSSWILKQLDISNTYYKETNKDTTE